MGILTNLSFFSGYGGLDLGAKMVGGIQTVGYCEVGRYAQGVLKSRIAEDGLDDAPIWDDVKTFDGRPWRGVDIVSGGFPCTDISGAAVAEGKGIEEGTRSGLFYEQMRVCREVGPKFILLENVARLLVYPGIHKVLGELASMGFDAGWKIISASAIGARHRRKRIWIVAYPHGVRWIKNEDAGKNLRERRSLPQKTWDFNGTSVGFENSDRLWCFPDTTLERNLDGFAYWVDRLECCGNGVVPQQSIPAWEEIKRLSSLAYG